MKVAIIGGGTSGWWTAGALEQHFPDWDITLIESDTIPTIGVGESCTPPMVSFMRSLGIDESDWMGESNAIFKWGNIKQGWAHPRDGEYLWPFWYNDHADFDSWYRKYRVFQVDRDSLNDFVDHKRFEPPSYAYHVCAHEMGAIVKNNCKNVKHEIATITEKPDADLIIDCTGFAKRFVEDREEIHYNDLVVDSAIVCPHELMCLSPHTRSIARKFGWQFLISLKNRTGTGYCYSSNHVSDEDAMKEFLEFTSERGMVPLRDEPIRFKWKPHSLKNPWSGNVVAIGISAGFVDPLEANQLFHTQHQIEALVKCFKRGYSKETYNRAMRIGYANTADFVAHHYALAPRRDTEFWRYWDTLGKDFRRSLWENYRDRTCVKAHLYPSMIWAHMAVNFNEFTHYEEFTKDM